MTKQELWRLYREGRAPRPPVLWGCNPRVVLLDPALNARGWTFEAYWRDPAVGVAGQLAFLDYLYDVVGRHSDLPEAPPERWTVRVDTQNVTDGCYFGGEAIFPEGQVPTQEPFLRVEDAEKFLGTPFDPESNPFLQAQYARRDAMEKAARGMTHRGRPVEVSRPVWGSDGPVTTGLMIFGGDFPLMLGDGESDLADRIMEKIVRDSIRRNRYMLRRAGRPERMALVEFADDSIQLISTRMYRERVLPWHRLYYEEMGLPGADRSMHLCGDATRHFRVIRDELGVGAFDTGFPVDHGALRRELGPDVEIQGGPHVSFFTDGAPSAVAEETRRILASGVAEGGRFLLREGNNMPPCVPEANLAAAYGEALAFADGGRR